MNVCMNVLYDSQAFLPSAALIVAILVMWAQWSARIKPVKDSEYLCGKQKARKEATQVLGLMWILVAILFALAAFALHVLGYKEFANAFLSWSVLMTFVSVLLSLVIKLWQYIKEKAEGESLIGELKGHRKCLVSFATILAIVGLGLLSFSAALMFGSPLNPWFWVGVGLVVIAAIFVIVLIRERLWTCIRWVRWVLWEKRKMSKRVKLRYKRKK